MHVDEAGHDHVTGQIHPVFAGGDRAQAGRHLDDAAVFNDQRVIGGNAVRQDQIGAREESPGHSRTPAAS